MILGILNWLTWYVRPCNRSHSQIPKRKPFFKSFFLKKIIPPKSWQIEGRLSGPSNTHHLQNWERLFPHPPPRRRLSIAAAAKKGVLIWALIRVFSDIGRSLALPLLVLFLRRKEDEEMEQEILFRACVLRVPSSLYAEPIRIYAHNASSRDLQERFWPD